MEVLYNSKKVGSGQFQVRLDADTESGKIEQLYEFQNLFEKNNICGLCKSEDVSWNIRENEGGKYYEKKCNNPGCYATLPYHLNKDKVKKGGLYFSYKDKWIKYDPNNKPKKTDDEEVFNEKRKGK